MRLLLTIYCWLLPMVLLAQEPLDAYLKEAAQNNPGLKARYLDYQAALQKVPQVGALPDPEVSFGYFISPIETRVGPQRMRFSAMQMFPWLGTLDAKKETAALLAKARFEEFEQARNQLFSEVKATWCNLYELEHATRITARHIELVKSWESLSTTRFEAGTASMVDVLRAQMELAELENQLQGLRDKRVPLLARFNQHLGRPVATPIAIPDTIAISELTLDRTALSDSIHKSNPALRSIMLRQDAAAQAGVAAQKMGGPSFGLGLSYMMTGQRTDVDVPQNGKDAIMPMVSVRIPLYRSRYRAIVSEADLQQQALQQQEAQQLNVLSVELEQQLAAYADADRRISLYREQHKRAEQAMNLLLTAYTTNGKDFEEVLRLERMLLNYELETVKAVRDKNTAAANIERLY